MKRQALRSTAGRLPDQQAHALQLDTDIRHHERHRLAPGNWLTERLAFLDEGNAVVEHCLAATDRQRRQTEARQVDEALKVKILETIQGRHAYLLKSHRGSVQRAQAHIGLRLGRHTGGAPGNHKRRRALALDTGNHKQHDRAAAEGHQAFFTADHIVIAVALCGTAQVSRIKRSTAFHQGN